MVKERDKGQSLNLRQLDWDRAYAIEHFYDLLNELNYREAYSLLSSRYQAQHPYDAWVDELLATVSIRVTTSDRGGSDTIGVDLIVTELSSGPIVTRHLIGTWRLIYSSQANQWLLDEAKLSEAK